MFLESERWSLTKPSIFKKIEYINNMKTSSTLDKILNGKPKADLLGVLTSGEDMHRTFGDFLKELQERNAQVYTDAFMTLTVAELVAAASKLMFQQSKDSKMNLFVLHGKQKF